MALVAPHVPSSIFAHDVLGPQWLGRPVPSKWRQGHQWAGLLNHIINHTTQAMHADRGLLADEPETQIGHQCKQGR